MYELEAAREVGWTQDKLNRRRDTICIETDLKADPALCGDSILEATGD